jgi:peptide-methionine (S)-S-oxide reductase
MKQTMSSLRGATLMLILSAIGWSCSRPVHAAEDLPKPQADLPAAKEGETARTAVFGGGCFWSFEAIFEQLNGVTDVTSGYAGDTKENAKYDLICAGGTNHAETIKITYDPSKITYAQLLRVFFATHDPTTKDRQGADWGRQYRSAIFFANDDEKRVAESYIKQVTDAKVFGDPIVTTLEPLTEFFSAEKYHQDFVRLNPDHPYVVQAALPKIRKAKERFADEMKE